MGFYFHLLKNSFDNPSTICDDNFVTLLIEAGEVFDRPQGTHTRGGEQRFKQETNSTHFSPLH